MSSTTYKQWRCDRCTKTDRFEHLPTRWTAVEVYPNAAEKGRDNGKNYDLCPDCSADWFQWIAAKSKVLAS